MNKPAKNVVLITGAATRIGAATARHLHRHNMDIAIHYRHSGQPAEQLQQELEQHRPGSTCLLQADLLDNRQIQTLIDGVEQHFGQLDALVNNASSFYPTPVGEMDEDAWNDLIGSNLKAPLFLAQAAVPLLKKTRGSIVNLVDIHAFRPMKRHTIYSVAKAGNRMLIQSLARELAPDIRVNGVAPGAIAWPENETGEALKNHILSRIPLQRKGEFSDIARTIRFLIQEAPYITGQIIAVDGGRMTQQ